MARKRVLIVDDEDDIREVAQLSLEVVGGWEVLTARSGSEALALAEAERPDAIVMDMMMPEMDGLATFQRLRENPRVAGIPVILLTAKVQAADQRRFIAAGVVGVLPKPFDPMGLAGDVARMLEWES